MVIKKVKSKKNIVILSLLGALLVLALIAYALLGQNKNQSQSSPEGKDAVDTYDKIDYAPADSEDKAYNDQIKENLGQGESPQSTPNSATIIVTDANQYGQDVEVRAFVSNVIQDNGTCTLTFTGPGTKVVKTVKASADVSTTRCENVTIPADSFDKKGSWQLTVSYTSGNTSGQSEPKTIEIK